jgi:hypothetical protein
MRRGRFEGDVLHGCLSRRGMRGGNGEGWDCQAPQEYDTYKDGKWRDSGYL